MFQPQLYTVQQTAGFNPGPWNGRKKKNKKATDVVLDNNDPELFNALF